MICFHYKTGFSYVSRVKKLNPSVKIVDYEVFFLCT